jgi:hypothetical protein
MKISLHPGHARHGIVLFIVLIMLGISLLILAADLMWTNSTATLNQRHGEYEQCSRAAEAAVEKVYACMAYDFQSSAVKGVQNNSAHYYTNVPTASENSYWTNFIFSDPSTGLAGYTYVQQISTFSGPLPTAYVNRVTANAPMYRIISNVKKANSGSGIVGTAQEDVLLALVPLNNFAIFYNGLLDFTNCNTMTVSGPVYDNGPIQLGSSCKLTFMDTVSTTATITYPYPGSNNVVFMATPPYLTNAQSVTCSLNMTNSHFLIDIPPAGEDSMSSTGQQRLYNQANMVLLITNPVVGSTNPTVQLVMQISSDGGITVPGADLNKNTNTFYFTNASPSLLRTNLPFLSLTNSFYDQRDTDTNVVTQIDVGAYAQWAATNTQVLTKFPPLSASPTLMYVADQRSYKTNNQLAVVRLSNAAQLPANNGIGFSVATPNPLYTWGNYNTTTANGSSTGTNNTYEVPSALLSDALTVLSSSWTDAKSFQYLTQPTSRNNPVATTINAAIVSGNVMNTGNGDGGVENLPRLLENWNSLNLYLNTSIICLWRSTMATNVFQTPSTYYTAPTRFFSFDRNFLNPANRPPGIPVAYVPLRFGYAVPAPGVVNYTPTYN